MAATENMERKATVEKGSGSQLETPSAGGSEHLDFGGETSLPPPPALTAEEERKLWRKIDLRLMPILSLMYLFSFLDRGNIGNARLQGLETQLGLTGNKFNIALTMYFIPYCIFECPANMVLKRFLPSRWLPGITVVWGIITTLMGLVKTYPQLVGTRICLGVAEAGLFPGVAFYLTLWYPRHMLQWRIGLFFGAASLAGAWSGALAFGISFMSGTRGLLGWSWIFILEGIGTVIVGIVAFFVLVDFPVTAAFLTPEERAFVVSKKKYDNSAVGEEEHFEIRHLVEALTDWQVWLHMLVLMALITNLYGITLFLPTIIATFGHSAAVSNLLTVPPYQVLATIVVFIFAYWSDRAKVRSPFIFAGLIFNLIGFSINISNVPSGLKYFGTFFSVTGAYAAIPGVIAWLGNNLSGQYKRGVGMAFQIGIGLFGGAFASNMYRTQDMPRFRVGHGCEIMFVLIGLISVAFTAFISRRVNRHRDEVARAALERGENKLYSDKALREMGDRAPDFRYTL
ncbi:MFS general substrate transporter [Mycena capillaripes]|nr:MFS general substrate transporter [Mycena capillaripes]